MDVFICFNPNKPTLYKERLLTQFTEYSFENALEQLTINILKINKFVTEP